MKHRFTYLMFTVLTLAGQVVMSADSVRRPAGDIDIVVNGVAQPRYAHQGRWYVEALKGREYAIRIRNPYGVRVAVALSVDGLNTIDARQTTADAARKWVLAPYETVTISGWQTSQTEARRFEFTTEEHSYGQALGKTANLGVISAVFFKERVATPHDRGRERCQSALGQQRRPLKVNAVNRPRAVPENPTTNMLPPGWAVAPATSSTQVRLDLEDAPAQTVNIRYEFRPQLVRLGVLSPAPTGGHLERRERARGFEPGFCPEPPKR